MQKFRCSDKLCKVLLGGALAVVHWLEVIMCK